ncbi:hypothetical protein RAH41_15280 [Gottfriedia acidiceleris]|uniref:hypothetical protein n=1 Tax=Gottfriedia acidiceleris TaxID=371036 RepID=UPI002F2659E0
MWGFCGCNRRREEREEVSPVRDMREFVEVRRPCNECDCHRNNDHHRVMSESMHNDNGRFMSENMHNSHSNRNENRNDSRNENRNENRNMSNNRRGGCRRNRNRNMNNSMVSPATSSFCETQLEAARNSCVANPFTAFNRCNNNNNM